MDVQVGDVDIQSLQIPGAQWVAGSLVVAMMVYIVSTLYSLWHSVRYRTKEPLLGTCEL